MMSQQPHGKQFTRMGLMLLLAGALVWPGMAQPAGDLTQFDNSAYARVLTRFVDAAGRVDYAGLKADRAGLDQYVALLGALEPMTYNAWNGAAKLAFWLNAYNAITLQFIINHYPIRATPGGNAWPANSVRQIPGMWDGLHAPVMGRPVTLDSIMHKMLREQFRDPRIHTALVCGTRGAPPLRNEPYDARRLDEQLHAQATRMLGDAAREKGRGGERVMRVSLIFKWFAADFMPIYETQAPPDTSPSEREAVLWYVAQTAARGDWNALRDWRLEYLPYDWTLNER